MLHDVPLNTHLRPLRLKQQAGPPPAGSSKRSKSVVHLAFLLPGPGCPLALWGSMVRRFCQGHGDAHPCIPQVSTEASLSSPPCGTQGVVNTSQTTEAILAKCHTKQRKCNSLTCGGLCCWLLLVVGCCWWLLVVVVGCCWLLLVVVGCCWLLLVVGCCWWLLVVVGCCCWLLLVVVGCCWLLLVVVVVVVGCCCWWWWCCWCCWCCWCFSVGIK